MARGLGCVQYADGTRRYFVRCETTGGNFEPLFATAKEASEVYDRGGVEALINTRCQDDDVQVVGIAKVPGWSLLNDDECTFDDYALATRDRLVHARDDESGKVSLQQAAGVLHVAFEVSGGFGGDYDVPMCDRSADYNAAAIERPLSAYAGQRIALCPHCVAALLSK